MTAQTEQVQQETVNLSIVVVPNTRQNLTRRRQRLLQLGPADQSVLPERVLHFGVEVVPHPRTRVLGPLDDAPRDEEPLIDHRDDALGRMRFRTYPNGRLSTTLLQYFDACASGGAIDFWWDLRELLSQLEVVVGAVVDPHYFELVGFVGQNAQG